MKYTGQFLDGLFSGPRKLLDLVHIGDVYVGLRLSNMTGLASSHKSTANLISLRHANKVKDY